MVKHLGKLIALLALYGSLVFPSSFAFAQLVGDNYVVEPYLETTSYEISMRRATVNVPLYFKIENFSSETLLLSNLDLRWNIYNLSTGALQQGIIPLDNGAFSGFSGFKQWPHSVSISPIKDYSNPQVSLDLPPGKYSYFIELKLKTTGAIVLSSQIILSVQQSTLRPLFP